MLKNRIKKTIIIAVDEINQQLPKDQRLGLFMDTELFGHSSKLDSLGLVNLIVSVEAAVEEQFDTTITIADERAMSQKHSPFRTIGTLVDYVAVLLKEKTSD